MIRGLLLALLVALAPCVASAQMLLRGAGLGGAAAASLPVPVFGWSNQGTASASTTTVSTSKGANTITVGDLLYAVLALTDNVGTNHSVTCPTGFAQTSAWSPSYDTNTNEAACWKIAGAGDTGGVFAFNWTTNISQIGQWTLMDFTGANATTPIDISGNGQNTATGPSITTTGANRLVISCSSMAGSSVTVTTQPSGMTNLFTGASGGNIRTQCASVTQAAAGASGTKAWTWSAANPVQTFNSAIAP